MSWSEEPEDLAGPSSWRPMALLLGLADVLVVGAFLLLLLVAPFPMGANRDWAWTPMVVAAGGLAVVAALGPGGRGGFAVVFGERGPLLLLLACFGFYLAVALLQMSTLAPAAGSAAFYARAAAILGQAAPAVPSLAVDASRNTLLKCLACGLIFAVARCLFADQRRARLLLMTLIASALVVMVYALYIEREAHSCYLGGFLKKQGIFEMSNDRCLMSGTFVSSNSFGCFMGMAVVATLALLFADRRPRRIRGDEDDDEADGSHVLDLITGPRLMLVALGFMFMGGALISGSRAGFASGVAGVLALGWLLMRGRWRSRSHFRRTFAVSVLVVLVIGSIAGSALMHKMAMPNADSFNRIFIWRASIDAIRQSPWLGWGLGSFNDIYAVDQPTEIVQPNDKAHSTPLETVVELGLPGGLAALVTVLLPWLVCLRGAWQRQRRRYLPAAAFAVSGVAILHSTVDFSLQIPAIGFMVSALLGMGWAQAFGRSQQSRRSLRHRAE
jgi:O-antigen ligase